VVTIGDVETLYGKNLNGWEPLARAAIDAAQTLVDWSVGTERDESTRVLVVLAAIAIIEERTVMYYDRDPEKTWATYDRFVEAYVNK